MICSYKKKARKRISRRRGGGERPVEEENVEGDGVEVKQGKEDKEKWNRTENKEKRRKRRKKKWKKKKKKKKNVQGNVHVLVKVITLSSFRGSPSKAVNVSSHYLFFIYGV